MGDTTAACHPLTTLTPQVHGAEGLRLEGDAGGPAAAGAAAGTRLYCVVAGGPLRMRTRSLPRCTDPAWHEVFVFKEDEVLMSGLATSFEVVTTRRWGSDLALAQVMPLTLAPRAHAQRSAQPRQKAPLPA